jgi:ABC-2 type transport system permease protein
MPVNTARATSILARVHAQALVNSIRELLGANKTMTLTISVFLGAYAAVAYVLVGRGLAFVNTVPLLGPMLTERLIYMLFFSFFVMLVVSNATITGMGLFRRNETGWLLTLPLSHRSLVLWKTFEGMALASWGLLLLSAPLLGAIAELFQTDFWFYLGTLPALLCLVAIAAHLSTWLLLMLMRWLRWSLIRPVLIGLGVALTILGVRSLTGLHETLKPTDMAQNVGKLLQHTEIFSHPLLPSSWVAEAVLAAGRGQVERTWFYNLMLLSWAMASVLVTIRLSTALFYDAWSRSLLAADTRRARSVLMKLHLEKWLPISRVSRSLVVKDIQTFAREPAQWGQSAVIFGLLFLYTANLRRIVFDPNDVFWAVVTSYLNLLVCMLALSTLTTRFIYPQISLEGKRIWVLGLAPVSLPQMLDVKLWLSTFVTGSAISLLISLSCWTLRVSWERTFFFLIAVWMMAFGMSALALGLGTLFPNFKETNPAKIVSGFGGTLCLISSFLYIASSMIVSLAPALGEMGGKLDHVAAWLPQNRLAFAVVSMAILTLVFGALPYLLAKKRIKDLDYFGKCNI